MQIMAYLAGFSYSIAQGTIRTLTGNERILIPSPDRTLMNFSFCIVYAACLKDTAAKLEQPAELLSFIQSQPSCARCAPSHYCTSLWCVQKRSLVAHNCTAAAVEISIAQYMTQSNKSTGSLKSCSIVGQ